MGVFFGFDPGGAGAFGWCVLEGTTLPLQVLGRGVGEHAQDAMNHAMDIAGNKTVSAIGIDAPLFWRRDGDRHVDQVLRTQVVALGGRGGTVNSVNSMRGACLVQGVLVGLLARQLIASRMPVSESHPKAALWLLRLAYPGHPTSLITLEQLGAYFSGHTSGASDHERDAAIGALSAFAMIERLPGWHDLSVHEPSPVFPIQPPLGYWMPC